MPRRFVREYILGISIRIENQNHDEVERVVDDVEGSFARICQSAPETSMRRGILPWLDTMLNPYQLGVLVRELESLPGDQTTAAVSRVIDAAERAIRLRGYLYFIGD
ncbi:hypothetical protein [Amycolatopsis pigmentata]|uniref:Uncharacterized protein n=1 Tax=Amycolatopsis pigmentata TaxID=450801 RepID=A0ABW5G821_9PSEU